jgi:hypothetical protein
VTISTLSEELLRLHAHQPQHLFYGSEVLGSLYYQSELGQLDEAYKELVEAGLMERSGSVISFFGSPKTLHRITNRGLEYVATQPAA